ncbi:MAG: aspartate aminotransferase family protein [Thermosulfidibacteraceae bacterium]|jgi:glutamate-1-semialdehyde 2,1-aminomutase
MGKQYIEASEDTETSKQLFLRALKVIPGGVSHNVRYYPPYPVFIERCKGSKIWDVDGNCYIDYWMGHYAHIMGHSYPEVVEAVTKFIRERGYHFGLVNREEVELAELILSVLDEFEMVRFCTSGSDAGSFAVRLARAYTGKNKVLKVRGGWHGASTDLIKGSSYPFEEKESLGILDNVYENVILMPFNDWEETERIIEENKNDIACAIVEPVLGSGGFIPADKDYLVNLRKKLEEIGALLIFDEVITGFRVSLKGYYGYIGVVPHILTIGKIVGGGFPIGVIVSTRDIMELSSRERSKPSRVLIGGGTFSCNPVSMVAGLTVIKRLISDGDKIYPSLANLTEKLRNGIEEVAKSKGIKVRTTGVGSLFKVHILKVDADIKSADDVYRYTYWEEVDGEYRSYLAKHGVNMVHLCGAISYAHTNEDVEETIKVFDEFFSWLRERI